MKNILIVDDEDSIRLSLHAFFEDCSFKTLSSPSSENALKMMEDNQIDLTIVDLRLPDMDGEELIRRAHKKWPDMRFIIHTGSVETVLSDDIKKISQISKKLFIKPVFDLASFKKEIYQIFDITE